MKNIFSNKKNENPDIDIIPSLAKVVEENGLSENINLCLPVEKENIEKHKIIVSDEKNFGAWNVESITELFRGNKQPPNLKGYPKEYIDFLYIIERNVMVACDTGKRTPVDEEFIDIYRAMSKRPDGKSLGFIHDVIWQAAALGLGLKPYSCDEYEAIFKKLVQSVRTWKTGYSSRNYVGFISQHI